MMSHVILVVEDDGDVREAVCDVLTDVGHEVRAAADGTIALELLRTGTVQPCLILLDIMLPDLTGIQVAARLRADPVLRALPIVFFSATGRQGLPADATLLHKPVNLDELLATIDLRCGRPEHRRARHATGH